MLFKVFYLFRKTILRFTNKGHQCNIPATKSDINGYIHTLCCYVCGSKCPSLGDSITLTFKDNLIKSVIKVLHQLNSHGVLILN